MVPSELESILKEFVAESREHLSQFELAIVELESEPEGDAALQVLFRAVHSIKGSCGFFGLTRLETLTHAGESLLDEVRSGRTRLGPDVASALLSMVDGVRTLLAQVEADGTEGPLDVEPVCARLISFIEGETDAIGAAGQASGVSTSGLDGGASSAGHDSKIRVETALLERLMDLTGELVLARNQVVQLAVQQGASLAIATQRLSTVTSELQEVVMKTRMQPIGHVFSRFPRVARDIALSLGKRIHLMIEGRETELDKSLLEAIQDPLTHLVRNAIGHGIEEPAERERAGKLAEGVIRLRAFHEAGMVNVEVADDGGGIDLERIRRTAVRAGIASAEEAARMPERDLVNLVFLPGFSTQGEVNAVAGRGVGMDVVKTNIESIGGSIELQSERGRGTTVKIKIPLTLAIIPALIVKVGGERYAIPQACLLEVVRLEGEEDRRVELIQESLVLRLREKILPLIHFASALGIESRAANDGATAIVVLQAGDLSFGLVVDEIEDTEEIVVKPLWSPLRELGCYAGATVLSDGRVALILEPLGLAAHVGVSVSESRASSDDHAARDAGPSHATEQVLLCRAGTERLAIRLSNVARLEHLPAESVERSGGTEVAQYRGRILPLVRASMHLEERRSRPRTSPREGAAALGALPVVVYSEGARSVGIVVDAILDVVDVEVELERTGARRGVLGSMVVKGRVTELLDVEGVIRSAEPSFYGESRPGAEP